MCSATTRRHCSSSPLGGNDEHNYARCAEVLVDTGFAEMLKYEGNQDTGAPLSSRGDEAEAELLDLMPCMGIRLEKQSGALLGLACLVM